MTLAHASAAICVGLALLFLLIGHFNRRKIWK